MPNHPLPDLALPTRTPGVHSFALLGGLEAAVRAILVSVVPLEMYRALGDADTVSLIYFGIGLISLVFGLMVPSLTRVIPRRWCYSMGVGFYLAGQVAGLAGGAAMPFVVLFNMLGTVTLMVCLNAYVLDYIAKHELGRNETLRMVYAGTAWTVGPLLGVMSLGIWRPLPYLMAGGFALILLATFWVLRLGNGKVITKARGPAPNPVAYLSRFVAQPRLIVGWSFAVIRSAGWWVFVVYLPIYGIEAGLDERIGGLSLSLSSALMFGTPLVLRWMQATSVRWMVRLGFASGGLLFAAGGVLALLGMPWTAVAVLILASTFLLVLDVAGNLPFLLAVKPSERTEMAAVYSSFRDVSGILTPGVAWVVLLVAPLPWLFVVTGAGMGVCWAMAGRLHPRLGARK